MQKVFLDTNIVIDFLGERDLFYISTAKLITLADLKSIQIFTSPVSICNAYYLLSKNEGHPSTLNKISKFKLICEMSIMDNSVVEKAILSDFSDFEDSLQYYSALESKCDIIITRNEKDFKKSAIPVMNAERFLVQYKTAK